MGKGKFRVSYIVDVLNGMAKGLFSSLIIGLIISQIGKLTGIEFLINTGSIIKYMMGPAIGIGVAMSVNANPYGIIASGVAAAIGAGTITASKAISIGDPIGALIAGIIAAEVSKLLEQKTKFDLILVPFCSILVAGFISIEFAPYISSFMVYTGNFINELTKLHPIPMGILISVIMGIILTLPISSAAIAISLGLSGIAAGASTIGCSCQMIGFAVMSVRDNRLGEVISLGIGTSMLQIPNIVRNPRVWIPPILTSAILAPFAILLFDMQNLPYGAGMGTSGLVGQIGTIEAMGQSVHTFLLILLFHFLAPALLTYVFYYAFCRLAWIREGDLTLNLE